MIPLCDPKQQYFDLRSEIDEAIRGVAAAGRYILGPNVRELEKEVAAYCQAAHGIGVGSGTDALHLALRALGVGPGDEVITTPFTFVATTEAIGMVGATPVFVDVEPSTYNLDAAKLPEAITPHTKAIVPVHLYGRPCAMDAILGVAREHSLFVVEDCAQAMGATSRGRPVGSLGDAGCFSFFPSKNLGCLGDGGMVVTNNPAIRDRVDSLRRHGGKVKYHHSELGLNSRLDEVQAAVLRVKLRRLDEWNERRRAIARFYSDSLSGVTGLTLPAQGPSAAGVGSGDDPTSTSNVFHQYTLRHDRRDELIEELREHGVQAFPYYPKPLHLQEVHSHLGHRPGDFPAAEEAAATCVSLPMYPELSDEEQRHVVEAVKASAARLGAKSVTRANVTASSDQHEVEFSQAGYRDLLSRFLERGYRFASFSDAGCGRTGKPYVLLRHDIDMDLQRAEQMARVESELGVCATYFFLLRTEHYNPLSREGSESIRAILDLGHHLGLHYDCAAYQDTGDAEEHASRVVKEARLLGEWFDEEVSIVSFHRPDARVLTGDERIAAPLQHTYMKRFVGDIEYCSDSRGRFRYKRPTETEAFQNKLPLQLLIHPIWWGESASDPQSELTRFELRRHQKLRRSIQENCEVASRGTRVDAALAPRAA